MKWPKWLTPPKRVRDLLRKMFAKWLRDTADDINVKERNDGSG